MTTMQRRKPLVVTLETTQPSVIELTAHEALQLDRLIPSSRGHIAERYGALVPAGTTRVSLDVGQFCFKALSDTQLRVVQGGVQARTSGTSKDMPPPAPSAEPAVRGDDPEREVPRFTLATDGAA